MSRSWTACFNIEQISHVNMLNIVRAAVYSSAYVCFQLVHVLSRCMFHTLCATKVVYVNWGTYRDMIGGPPCQRPVRLHSAHGSLHRCLSATPYLEERTPSLSRAPSTSSRSRAPRPSSLCLRVQCLPVEAHVSRLASNLVLSTH